MTSAVGAALSSIKSGTEMYMSLYPEKSTDSGIRLGNIVPDFKADTTHGPMEFHKWKEGKVRLRGCVSRAACALSPRGARQGSRYATAALSERLPRACRVCSAPVGDPLLAPGRLHARVHD